MTDANWLEFVMLIILIYVNDSVVDQSHWVIWALYYSVQFASVTELWILNTDR